MLAGAKSHLTNTVGRTAAQMAAFVGKQHMWSVLFLFVVVSEFYNMFTLSLGNHNCVVVINNYVPKSDVEYYTTPKGVETKPKLHPSLSEPLYTYIMQVGITLRKEVQKLSKNKLYFLLLPVLGKHTSS